MTVTVLIEVIFMIVKFAGMMYYREYKNERTLQRFLIIIFREVCAR